MSGIVYKKHAKLEGTHGVNKEREEHSLNYNDIMSMQQLSKSVGLNGRV